MRIDRRVFVPGHDGTKLALTVYLPDDGGPFPAVVESLPYRKDDDCTARDWQTYSALTDAGIAGIRIDIRGTGASEGIIGGEYLASEQLDNVAVMDWAAEQSWCTGVFGMWGISWGGFSSLQTAMLQPHGLAAIAPMHATHDRFACDVHYIGGSLHAAEQVDWPPSMISANALPPDPDIVGEVWFEQWMKRLEHTPQWHPEWIRHQRRDEFWLHGSPIVDYGSIRCPTLLIGGWLDGYVDGMLELAGNLTCPTRTVIGPWGHHRPASGVPAPTLDHLDLLVRWFGHHLRGDANGIMEELAPVTLFLPERPSNHVERIRGQWIRLDGWPPPQADDLTLSLADLAPYSTVWSGPQWVGAHAPAWDRSGVEVSDSSPDDAASMTFETDPASDDLVLIGVPTLEVTVSTDQAVGMIAARLIAIDPDDETFLLARGNRNLAFPGALDRPETVQPDTPMKIIVPLMVSATTVPAGWRLRLAVAGADFPVVWPPGRRFTLTLDPERSALRLPVVAPPLRTVRVPEAADLPAAPVDPLTSIDERTVSREGTTTVYERRIGHREHQPTRDGLEYGHDQIWRVSVDDDDPATTSVAGESTMALERGDWSVATTGNFTMTGTAEAFHVTIGLVARHGTEEVFRRTWEETVPRRWA